MLDVTWPRVQRPVSSDPLRSSQRPARVCSPVIGKPAARRGRGHRSRSIHGVAADSGVAGHQAGCRRWPIKACRPGLALILGCARRRRRRKQLEGSSRPDSTNCSGPPSRVVRRDRPQWLREQSHEPGTRRLRPSTTRAVVVQQDRPDGADLLTVRYPLLSHGTLRTYAGAGLNRTTYFEGDGGARSAGASPPQHGRSVPPQRSGPSSGRASGCCNADLRWVGSPMTPSRAQPRRSTSARMPCPRRVGRLAIPLTAAAGPPRRRLA